MEVLDGQERLNLIPCKSELLLLRLGSRIDETVKIGVSDEKDVDLKLAVPGGPIVGMEMVT